MALSQSVRKTLGEIVRGYRRFLAEGGLRDEPLARMTYFTTARKVFGEDPQGTEDEEAELLKHLDRWIAETEEDMRARMMVRS